MWHREQLGGGVGLHAHAQHSLGPGSRHREGGDANLCVRTVGDYTVIKEVLYQANVCEQ